MNETINPVPLQELQALCDFSVRENMVRNTLRKALADPVTRLRFLGNYTSWNGFFGSGVATLSGKIGRCRGLFLDPAQPIRSLADRSVYVASFFFDAARDEFDDRDTVHRDTHRCLAQSTLKGLIDFGARQGGPDAPAAINALLDEPQWLQRLNTRVATGYGAARPDDLETVFACIGYHLGSELWADQEFSIIDATLREEAPDLVDYLKSAHINISGQDHVAYQWIAIHSGHGGGAEADHFEWATQGARLAFRFVPTERHETLKHHLHEGFLEFAQDHREFFERVNQPSGSTFTTN
jgi:hypothetical protein